MHADEAAFLAAIRSAPADADRWLVLADWLDEREDARGELVRLAHLLRCDEVLDRPVREARQRELMTLGVRPVVAELTNAIGMRLALVPAGSFVMGSPLTERDRWADEAQHAVRLTRPFFLGVFPVTQAEYRAITGESPATFGPGRGRTDPLADLLPVENVSWTAAVSFCARLSALPAERAAGRVYRLPTEAEWEYACRAGVQRSPFHFGSSVTTALANFDGRHPYGPAAPGGPPADRPTPVGSYPMNAWGLYDMHGNVWEWCQDWYGESFYQHSPPDDPVGPADGDYRVLRGGSWSNQGKYCRSAFRARNTPLTQRDNYGFRVAFDAG